MVKNKYNSNNLDNLANSLVAQGLLDPKALEHPRNLRNNLQATLDLYTKAVAEGYKKTLEIIAKDHGTKQAEHYRLKSLNLSSPEHQEKLQNAAREGRLMQACMEYSDDMLQTVFDIAVNLQEQKQWEDAVLVFTFLLYLCPSQSWFWYGLATCWHQSQQWDAAMYAYSMAISCDPTEIEFYRSACNCLLDTRETEKAKELLQYGIHQFESDHSKDAQENRSNLESALLYVNTL